MIPKQIYIIFSLFHFPRNNSSKYIGEEFQGHSYSIIQFYKTRKQVWILNQELQVSTFTYQYDPKVSGLSICTHSVERKYTMPGFLQVTRMNLKVWAEEISNHPSFNLQELELGIENCYLGILWKSDTVSSLNASVNGKSKMCRVPRLSLIFFHRSGYQNPESSYTFIYPK